MPAWTDTFSGEDIQDKVLWDMFHDAEVERANVSSGSVSAVTAHMSAATVLGNARTFAERYDGTFGDQWIPPRVYNGATWDRVTDLDGQQWDLTWWFNQIVSHIATVIPSGHWTHKVEKVFSTTASTAYIAGSGSGTAVNGDVGRCVADSALYTRTGGAWVLNAHPYVGDADLVDVASPSTVAENWGAWVLAEIRDVVNDMIWLYPAILPDSGTYVQAYSNDVGQDPTQTYASSSTAVAASFIDPGYSHSGTTGGPIASYSYFSRNPSDQVNAFLFASENVLISNLPIAAVTHVVQLLVAARALDSFIFGGSHIESSVFDANGFGVASELLEELDLTSATTATSYTSPTIGDVTVQPAFAGNPSTPGIGDPDNYKAKGFYSIAYLGVAKFESGFTYKL